MRSPTGAEQRHYQQIVGGTIEAVAWDTGCFNRPLPLLLVKMPSGKVMQCAVVADDECNGTGFLDIAERKA